MHWIRLQGLDSWVWSMVLYWKHECWLVCVDSEDLDKCCRSFWFCIYYCSVHTKCTLVACYCNCSRTSFFSVHMMIQTNKRNNTGGDDCWRSWTYSVAPLCNNLLVANEYSMLVIVPGNLCVQVLLLLSGSFKISTGIVAITSCVEIRIKH